MVEKSSTLGRTDGVIIPTIIAAHIAKSARKPASAMPSVPGDDMSIMPAMSLMGAADIPGIRATCTT